MQYCLLGEIWHNIWKNTTCFLLCPFYLPWYLKLDGENYLHQIHSTWYSFFLVSFSQSLTRCINGIQSGTCWSRVNLLSHSHTLYLWNNFLWMLLQSNLFKKTTRLRGPILVLPKQIPIQLLLYKTTTCLTRPATTFLSPKWKKTCLKQPLQKFTQRRNRKQT